MIDPMSEVMRERMESRIAVGELLRVSMLVVIDMDALRFVVSSGLLEDLSEILDLRSDGLLEGPKECDDVEKGSNSWVVL